MTSYFYTSPLISPIIYSHASCCVARERHSVRLVGVARGAMSTGRTLPAMLVKPPSRNSFSCAMLTVHMPLG